MYSPPLLFCPRCSAKRTLHPFSSQKGAIMPKSRLQVERQPCMAMMTRFAWGWGRQWPVSSVPSAAVMVTVSISTWRRSRSAPSICWRKTSLMPFPPEIRVLALCTTLGG